MPKPLKVLLIADTREYSQSLLRELSRCGYDPAFEITDTPQTFRAALQRDSWDIILSDYRLQSFDAPAALEILTESALDIPFVIVSDKIGEELAVAAIKAGAHDYLTRDNLSRLPLIVEREVREAADRRSRRREDEAVARAKDDWEAVFNAVTDLVFITDVDGIIQRCNGRASEYFGCHPPVIGRRIDQIFFGDGQPEGKVFRFVHGMQSEVDEDIRFPNMNGWFNVASYPMQFNEDRSGLVFIIKDITHRREMEEEKRTSDRELLTLYAVAFRLQYTQGLKKVMSELLFQLHNMLQMEFSFIHLFQQGTLTLQASLGLTPAFEKEMATLGKRVQWTALALAGRPFLGGKPDSRFPSSARAAAVKMGIRSWCSVPLMIGQEVMGVMTVGTCSQRSYNDREVFLLSAIAGQLAVLVENHNLYDQMKEKAEELFRSKEELRANLQQVERANLELGRLNTVKNNFIGIASHELKTPITSILGGAQFLLRFSGMQMTPEQQGILASVYEGATQLRNLVEDLLSISRIEAQGTLPHKKPANLMKLCREAHDQYMLPLSERRIRVQVAGEETPVPADEGFARMAIKNLLENAIKFTPDGGEITLSGREVKASQLKSMAQAAPEVKEDLAQAQAEGKSYYLLQVRDTGIGIPVHERVRIFDKFYGVGDIGHHTSGGTAFMSKGSGLGLSIVRGVMEAHEGTVWVEGEPGQGSTFSLLFPI